MCAQLIIINPEHIYQLFVAVEFVFMMGRCYQFEIQNDVSGEFVQDSIFLYLFSKSPKSSSYFVIPGVSSAKDCFFATLQDNPTQKPFSKHSKLENNYFSNLR